MKNIFKLMGIALMASSMAFVACSDDDDEVTNNPDVAEGVTVSFNGDNWNAPNAAVLKLGDDQVRLLAAEQDGSYPQFLAQFKYTKEKSYTGTINVDDDGNLEDGYSNEKITAVKYYTKSYMGENGPDADWWAKKATIEVTLFDEDAAKFSATFNAEMFSYEEWYENADGTDPSVDQVSNRTLTATAKNISLRAQ